VDFQAWFCEAGITLVYLYNAGVLQYTGWEAVFRWYGIVPLSISVQAGEWEAAEHPARLEGDLLWLFDEMEMSE
jgi:hypothetical protein